MKAAPFAHWELAARTAMADRGIGYTAAEPLIEEAKAHCAQSGESPWDAFGSPEDFAEAAAAERPALVRARRDRQGNTPGEYVSGAVFALAVIVIPASLVGAAFYSLSIQVTVAGLVGSLVFVLCWLTFFAAPGALRAAGHPRLAPWSYAVATVLVGVAAVVFVELPRTRLANLPTLLITAIGLLSAWLLTRPDRTDPAVVGTPTADEDDGLDLAADSDDDQWFERLNGLLVGRFDVPKERAAQFVDEARHHLMDTRTSPGEEFGPVAVYAMNLAAGEQQRQGPWCNARDLRPFGWCRWASGDLVVVYGG